MQYIGDAKSGRLVGADQCVEFHSAVRLILVFGRPRDGMGSRSIPTPIPEELVELGYSIVNSVRAESRMS